MRLLLVGTDTIHTYAYLDLVKDAMSEVLVISDAERKSRNERIEVVDFSLKNPWSQLFLPSKIRKLVNSFKPDLVHVHQASAVAYYTCRGIPSDLPLVVTAWGSDILLTPGRNFLLNRMVRYVLRRADALTSDSVFMADRIKELTHTKRPVLIANFGINETIPHLPKEKIIYSNRLHKPLYRIDRIIRSFEQFAETEEGKDWKLVIAGSGPSTEVLKKQASESRYSGRIQFTGWLDATSNSEWYARASVFVSIPESDATSISLLEAMNAGCFPVVSDLPANREWISDGINGRVDSSADLRGITEGMIHSASKLNRERIEKDGTRKVNRKKFLDLYQSLLNV